MHRPVPQYAVLPRLLMARAVKNRIHLRVYGWNQQPVEMESTAAAVPADALRTELPAALGHLVHEIVGVLVGRKGGEVADLKYAVVAKIADGDRRPRRGATSPINSRHQPPCGLRRQIPLRAGHRARAAAGLQLGARYDVLAKRRGQAQALVFEP